MNTVAAPSTTAPLAPADDGAATAPEVGPSVEAYDAAWVAAARRSWHPVARSEDVHPGGILPVTLLSEALLAWRTPDGDVALSHRACVHRGTDLATGTVTEDGCLRCPYHGWEFATDGRCRRLPQLGTQAPPPRAAQPGVRVAERAGLVWACLVTEAEESTPVPPLREADDRRWRHYQGRPLEWHCQAARHTENFCDLGHFSILHTSSFGNPDRTEVDPYRVETDGTALRFTYRYPGRDYLDQAAPAMDIDLDYEVHLPFTVVLRDINGPGSLIFTSVSPVTPTTSRIFWSSWRLDQPLDGSSVEAAETAILEEDRVIVEGQRPRRMPLDRRLELHLGFDRFAVAYRRGLSALGYPAVPPTEPWSPGTTADPPVT